MTFSSVEKTIIDFQPPSATNHSRPQNKALDLSHHLSIESALRRPSPLKEAALYLKNPNLVSLGGGLPDPLYFPFHSIDVKVPQAGHWEDDQEHIITIDKFHKADEPMMDLARALQYSQGTGQIELLTFAKEHTEMIHHPPYKDWDVLMTAGNTNSIDTCMRMLLNRGDTLLIEEYSFPSVLECARPQGIHAVSVKLDKNGIVPNLLDKQLLEWDEKVQGQRPRVLYTIPTGQNPTGSTLSPQRRLELYQVCQKHDLIILEDEPYYFLQMQEYISGAKDAPLPRTSAEFLQSLVPSILSMDVDGRVIRLDSFSKVIAPGCRCGWLTGSAKFMERALRYNEVSIQSPSGFSQVILNHLLSSWGHAGYLYWLVHIRAEYTKRRDGLLAAMESSLPKDFCTWDAPTAGMFIWIKLYPEKHPDFAELGIDALERKIFLTAIDKEVLVAAGSWFISDKAAQRPGLFFRATFAASSIPNMEKAMTRFGAALKDEFMTKASIA